MADLIIPGMTAAVLAKASTEAKTTRRDFPVSTDRYQRFTGAVERVETKVLGDDEKLSILVRNGDCVAEILVGLDVNKTFDGSKKTPAEQVQDNLDRLVLATKVLGIANAAGTGIDPTKFAGAKGRALGFSGKQTGTRTWEGRTYPKVSYILDGSVAELVPVSPWVDPSAASSPASDSPFEIPF